LIDCHKIQQIWRFDFKPEESLFLLAGIRREARLLGKTLSSKGQDDNRIFAVRLRRMAGVSGVIQTLPGV
jgi:hypothetical protein